MAHAFEIYGEVATEVRVNEGGDLDLILETSCGLEELAVPRAGTVGAEVASLSPGDRIVLEVERVGGELVVLEVRRSYIRGFPRVG